MLIYLFIYNFNLKYRFTYVLIYMQKSILLLVNSISKKIKIKNLKLLVHLHIRGKRMQIHVFVKMDLIIVSIKFSKIWNFESTLSMTLFCLSLFLWLNCMTRWFNKECHVTFWRNSRNSRDLVLGERPMNILLKILHRVSHNTSLIRPYFTPRLCYHHQTHIYVIISCDKFVKKKK